MLNFELLEFECHGFVLPVSSLRVSSVVQDLGYFLESFIEVCKVVVPSHFFFWHCAIVLVSWANIIFVMESCCSVRAFASS